MRDFSVKALSSGGSSSARARHSSVAQITGVVALPIPPGTPKEDGQSPLEPIPAQEDAYEPVTAERESMDQPWGEGG